MAVNNSIQKKRGRGRPPRPGGVDPVVPVRVPKEVLAAIDKWAEAQQTESRSEAVVALLKRGLEAPSAEIVSAAKLAARAKAPSRGKARQGRA